MTSGKPSPKPGRPSRWNRSVRPFVVVEDSMRPTLEPGDGVLAVRSRRIRSGQIRVFEHPERPGFWLVKRVGAIADGCFVAISDNAAAATVDSTSFGPVPVVGSYRMIARIPAHRLGTR